MASRVAAAVRSEEGDVKLIPYLMAGYPTRARSVEIGKALAGAGAAAIEVGIPHSDPLADGPVIQRAGKVAIDGGITVAGALEVASEVAREGIPVLVMTYVNPVLAYDPRRFAADAAQAGLAGVIIPDLPVDESEPIAGWMRAAGLDTVFLVAPTSTPERVERICEASTGFVYCVTVTGVTGPRAELGAGLIGLLGRVRSTTDLPIAAGFGISTPRQVRSLRGAADAAVVASVLIQEVEAGRDPGRLAREMVAACR